MLFIYVTISRILNIVDTLKRSVKWMTDWVIEWISLSRTIITEKQMYTRQRKCHSSEFREAVTGLQRCGQLEKYQKGPWCTEYREQPLLWAGMRASVSSCMWETNLQTTTVCKHYFITFLGVKILIEWYWEIIATHNLKNFLWGHVYQHRIPLKFIYFCDWFL